MPYGSPSCPACGASGSPCLCITGSSNYDESPSTPTEPLTIREKVNLICAVVGVLLAGAVVIALVIYVLGLGPPNH